MSTVKVTFLCFALCSLFAIASSQNTCHLRELDICAANLAVFAQGTGKGSVDDATIDRQCASITDAAGCIANYTKVCLTPTQRELSSLLFDETSKIQQEYCSKEGKLRKMYMKHAPCLASVSKEQKPCFKLLQAGLESISRAQWDKRIPYLCCTYHRLRGCFENLVKEKCGNEPLEMLHQLMRALLSRIPDLMCAEYQNENELCQEVPTIVAEGARSTSLINRLLSAYAGI